MNYWVFKMAWRDSRRQRGRLALYTASISIGIAALVALQSLATSLKSQVDLQASALLGADIQVSSKQPLTKNFHTYLKSLNAKFSEQIRLTSMIYLPRGSHSRLVEIRALSEGYPFYGKIETQPADAADTFYYDKKALVDETIMLQFNASVGDSIKIGNLFYEIEGKILSIPGETSLRSDIQPRVYIAKTNLDSLFLLQRGSRVEYSFFLKFKEEFSPEKLKKDFKEKFFSDNQTLNITTVEDRKRQIGRSLINLNRFLNLGAFVALLLGAVGVASAVQNYIMQKLDTVAVLRGIGATLRQSFSIYLVQAAAMGIWGSIWGTILGILSLQFLPLIFGDLLPVEISIQLNFTPIFQAIAIGLGLSLIFTVRPLLTIRKSSPLRALRSAYEKPATLKDRIVDIFADLLVVIVTFVFAYQLTGRLSYGIGFTIGIATAFFCLFGLARFLTWSLRRFFPKGWNYEYRQGLANLFRPNNQTNILLLGLGLGTFLVSTLYLAQNALISQIEGVGSKDRPNVVLFDIQTDQLKGLQSTFSELDLPVLQQVPIVTMRLHSVKGLLVREFKNKSNFQNRGRGGWALNREYRCTYRDTLNLSEDLVSGQWIGNVKNDTTYVSLESRIAENLNVTVGDSLVFDVQGVKIPVFVGSIREVDWQRIMPNFFVVFPNGILEEAPQFHVIVTRFNSNAQLANLQRKSNMLFPNISIIDLDLILSTVDTILEKVSFIIKFLAIFSLFTGIIVLIGIVAASRYQRVRESILLRTLGASKNQISRIMFLEYIFLGTLSALTGLALSVGSAWALSFFLFEIPFNPDLLPLFFAVPFVAGLTTLVGHLSARNVSSSPPLEILRNIT